MSIRKRAVLYKRGRAKAGPAAQAAAKVPVDGMFRGSDVGSQLAIDRKVVDYEAETYVPDDPDDKRSVLRVAPRAQRVWAPDRLLKGKNPAIEQHHHDAAKRFYDDFLIGELGARPNSQGGEGRVDPWARLPFSEQQAMRRQSFRSAVQAAGQGFGGILVWCVLQHTGSPDVAPTVEKWAERSGWQTERATGFLRGALEALAIHYGYTKASSPSAWRIDSVLSGKR